MAWTGDGYSFDVVEWWDSEGDYHKASELEVFDTEAMRDTFQVTGHYTFEDGSDRYTTMFSGDDAASAFGWSEYEFEQDVDEGKEGSP